MGRRGTLVVAQAGDFDAFYRAHYRPVAGLAYVLTGDMGRAEDLAQDAFAAAHRSWPKISGYDDPGAWVRRVVANRATSLRRRRSAEDRAMARLLVSPERAAQLGISSVPGAVVLRLPHALTNAQRLAVEEIAPGAAVFTPAKGVDPLLIEWALVGVALGLVLFVVAVNLALSAAETRDERDVLTVVGAAPGAMARTNGYKAALLTVMGAVLAIPIGFLPVAVYVHGAPGVIPLEFPWRVAALLVIAIPLVGGVIVTAGSAAALRLRPVAHLDDGLRLSAEWAQSVRGRTARRFLRHRGPS